LSACLWGVGVLTAGLTSFYSFRLLYLVFFGEYRGPKAGHHLSPLLIWTLPPLALLGLFGGFINLPHFYGGHEMFSHWIGSAVTTELPFSTEIGLLLLMAVVFIAGWVPAHLLYRNFREEAESPWRSFLLQGWYIDVLYEQIILRPYRAVTRFCWLAGDRGLIDGVVEGIGRVMLHWGGYFRQLATGQLSFYLQGFAWGLLLMLGWLLLKAAV
jgi:NADH-quinone oxidoreductase subunit L